MGKAYAIGVAVHIAKQAMLQMHLKNNGHR